MSGSLQTDPTTAIAAIADRCDTEAEFVIELAEHFQKEFHVGLVAVDMSDLNQPRIWIADEALAQTIDRTSLKECLTSASANASATDVRLQPQSSDGTNLASTARGYRIEFSASPNRIAVLLVDRPYESAAPNEQITKLRQLSQYAPIVRDVLSRYCNRSANHLERAALLQFHRSLDVGKTAYRITNETRRMIGCDRVMVLTPNGKKLRVRAVSGVAVVDRRSNVIRSSERLVNRAIVMSRPLIVPNESMLPPQIQESLDEYMDETGVTTSVILPIVQEKPNSSDMDSDSLANDPLTRDGKLVGVILLEYFSGQTPDQPTAAMAEIVAESSMALGNAMQYESIFGVSLWRWLGHIKHSNQSVWCLLGAIVVTAAIVASLLIQVDHFVIATGTAKPAIERHVFAIVDGTVKDLKVKDGDKVASGDVLMRLENAELEGRAATLAAQIQTTLERLSSIKAVRLSDGKQESESSRMAVDQQQYESELENLLSQQKVLRAEQDELVVESPIDGTILGWQLQERLTLRPVARGNRLLSVVDDHGPWKLDLQVPGRNAGAVIDSFAERGELRIVFAVATQPQRSYAATLQQIATSVRMNDHEQSIIDAFADVDPFDSMDVRIGADVTAKIYCGRRSLLESWFSDIIDFFYRKVLFPFR